MYYIACRNYPWTLVKSFETLEDAEWEFNLLLLEGSEEVPWFANDAFVICDENNHIVEEL